MEIERFAEIVKDGVIKRLGDGCQITIRKADKNNGVTYTGLNVRRGHLKLWDVTVNDLFRAAEKNTQLLRGYELKSMTDVLREIMESEPSEEVDYDAYMEEIVNGVPMYVLSSRNRIDGAACILYPTLLADICDSLQSSFYIIPSSIHEVLVLPSDSTDDSAKIREMIKEINDTQVAAEEILSYSLYFYNRDGNMLYIV